MLIVAHPWAQGRLFCTLLNIVDQRGPECSSVLSAHVPETGIMLGWISRKTPEESDDANTPHENRSKCEKLVRFIPGFSSLFEQNLTIIPVRECED